MAPCVPESVPPFLLSCLVTLPTPTPGVLLTSNAALTLQVARATHRLLILINPHTRTASILLRYQLACSQHPSQVSEIIISKCSISKWLLKQRSKNKQTNKQIQPCFQSTCLRQYPEWSSHLPPGWSYKFSLLGADHCFVITLLHPENVRSPQERFVFKTFLLWHSAHM